MVIDNDNLPTEDSRIIEMPGLKASFEQAQKKNASGAGMKEFKAPSKKKLEAMVEKLVLDNDTLAEANFKAGLTLCAIRKAAEQMIIDAGGQIVGNPAMEKQKKHLRQIVDATETWKDWDKPLEDPEEPTGEQGPDGNPQGSPAGAVPEVQ